MSDDPISRLMAAEGIGYPEAVEKLARRARDDVENLNDLGDVVRALTEAVGALRAGKREMFVFQVGFARGRLSRVSERIYQGGEFGERAGGQLH